jgi:O-antigen ligase
VVLSVLSQSHGTAQLVGAITLLRPIAALLVGYLVLGHEQLRVRRVFMVCAAVVGGFGFLQATVLPKDILEHIGYGAGTIPAYFTIDNNQDLIRIISTLRGPNSLGAYMVVVISMLVSFGAYLWCKAGNEKEAPFLGLALIVGLVTLYASGSRSAWLGVVVAGLVALWLWAEKKFRFVLVGSLLIMTMAGLVGARFYKDTPFVSQNILHTDRSEWNSFNSDDARRANAQAAKKDVLSRPFGYGVGSAGIASTYGKSPRIIENQYLLVAYQLGIVGAVGLLVLMVLLSRVLWNAAEASSWWDRGLVGAWLGLMLTAVFVPTFDDDAVGTILFILIGSSMGFVVDKAHAKVATDARTKTKHIVKRSQKARSVR